MNCKKCNADLTGKEYRTVAEWNFCPDCFNGLISPGGKEKNIKQAAEPDSNFSNRVCAICEEEPGENEGRDLLGSLFCKRCYENIVKRPPENQVPDHEWSRAEVNGKKSVAQVSVDFISQARCYQCGRMIRAIAGCEYQGNLYCPDCYFNIPEIKNPPPQAAVDASLNVESRPELMEECIAPGACVCQACQRELPKENLKIIEGFEICPACLAADPDTALEIARLRHRRRLEEIKKTLT